MQMRECTLMPDALPAPAPLPSLPTAFSRRAAIFGVMTVGAASVTAGASALAKGEVITTLPSALDSADPIPTLYRQAKDLAAAADGEDDDDVAFPIMDLWNDVERQAIASRPTSLAGVIAALEWAKWEHLRFNMTEDPDQGDRLMLALIEGALGVFKAGGRS